MADKETSQNRILTVPNLLSLFRLCLIPLFVWLYGEKQAYVWTGAVLILSGLTDLADGYIARTFNAVSDLGKILDPVADKLTQAAMLLCLFTRFPFMLLPFGMIILKELFMAVIGLWIIKKTGLVLGASWHGKVATSLLYAMMIFHVLWRDIPEKISTLSITVCAVMIAVSFVLYGVRNLRALKKEHSE